MFGEAQNRKFTNWLCSVSKDWTFLGATKKYRTKKCQTRKSYTKKSKKIPWQSLKLTLKWPRVQSLEKIQISYLLIWPNSTFGISSFGTFLDRRHKSFLFPFFVKKNDCPNFAESIFPRSQQKKLNWKELMFESKFVFEKQTFWALNMASVSNWFSI